METIKDVYISVGQAPLDGTLGRGSRLAAWHAALLWGGGYGTISCVACLLYWGRGSHSARLQAFSDPRFVRTETIMSKYVEHIYSIADSHAQTVEVCID